ncbi:Asd/ArgC dimerization domain-containing protein [Microbulbifer thermotolerans]|uniref:Aspartate-semialdehyde dehydrogenase n=1 Tax=Microbulbifer thermotolerans TaxID=252514 RepID=A0A143HKU4_MICTH|nr:Asd/ArgC dimerization domain-containing protein [Microbulbifer thermotolerans]AMX02137.1 aspartate-semialdehyde dehydrogenase [Microbulbifer thermotolerans]MCX2784291.1 Asd/ArgC dimerization domain-containing protein [Microbulbifer thermotolerans]SFB72582.1 Semialdehyde dehydrogenase, NAD binding domain [Microbulbifer thermotolerans]
MSESTPELVIVGVDNAAFAPLLEILEERGSVSAERLQLLEVQDSDVEQQVFAKRNIPVQSLEKFTFTAEQVVVLLKAGEAAQAALDTAEKAGAWVLDTAGNTRGDDSVTLVHPLINSDAIATAERRVLTLPVAGAAMVAEALFPLRDQLRRVEIQLNQPVSALGKSAVDAMAGQTARMFSGQDVDIDPAIGQRLAFNQLSSSEALLASGHNISELALIHDLRRLLGDTVAVDACINTASVFHGQLANLSVALSEDIDLEKVRALLKNGARLQMAERPSAEDAVGGETTLIGRLRQSLLSHRQVNFCAVSDNLRKDLAMNCVQIVHLLLKNY